MLPATAYAQQRLYGDVNGDNEVNIADINTVIGVILDGAAVTPAADVNSDGEINIADINAVIGIILGGSSPVPDGQAYVDLGLPSGTLWATCNIGASSPEQYGNYYAWGETAPKGYFVWSTYKWCNGSSTTMTKYCTDSSYGNNGFVDNKTELDPEDDAAYVNWGPSWRMPTTEQQRELSDKCTSVWTTQNGVSGRLFTGPNGNTLFLPAAGGIWGDYLAMAGSWGFYWSRTLVGPFNPDHAYGLDIRSYEMGWGGSVRGGGFTVRAVRVP